MLRAKYLKKCICLLLVAVIAFIPSVNLKAEGDDVLYFGALDESIAQNVKTAIVEKGEFYITGAVNASLEFPSQQMVFNDIREGTVYFKEFMVGQGDTVKKGDPIARISVSIDEIEKEEVELNLEAAKNNLDEYIQDTRLMLNQYKLAASTGSEKDRKLAQLSYDRLEATFKAEVEKRESRIDEYTLRLDQIEELASREFIYAPTDGVVGYVNRIRSNEVIGYWPPLCVLNDPTKVSVVVEGGSELLRYNMPVKIVQSSNGKSVELTGRVKTLKTSAYSVNLMAQNDVIEVYGDTTKLRPGSEVSVRFDKIYVTDALMVPRTAVKSDKKGSFVNVYVNGFSSKRYVVIGGADGTRNWIVSGVEEGDVIIME